MTTRNSEAVSAFSGFFQSIPSAFEIPKKIARSDTAIKIYDRVIDKLGISEGSSHTVFSCQSQDQIKTQKVRNVLFHNGLLDPATKGSWTLTEKGMIAAAFRLLDDDARELHEIEDEVLSTSVGETASDSAFHSQILENDPENLTALKHFLKLNRHDESAAGEWFVKLIHATIKRDFQSAVHLVRDYYPKHLRLLSDDILFSIGVEFYRYADYQKARLCLELAADKEGTWQHKALLILSRTWEALGNQERAIVILLDLLEQKPDKLFRLQAFGRLRILKESQLENLQDLTMAA
jgi:tetratricopeptide (TPR) repeat protein